MMDLPFYVPTSVGDLAAIGRVPDEGIGGPPVLLLAGRDSPRSKERVRWDIARDLAVVGRPCFRVDYPGVGLSAAPAAAAEQTVEVLGEAATWIRTACGASNIAVGGMCAGAISAVSLAARDPAIDVVVAVSLPFFVRDRSPLDTHVERARAAIAAVDPAGRRRSGRPEKRRRNRPSRWRSGLREDLATATTTARVGLFYGTEDAYYRDFVAGREDGRIPDEIIDRCSLVVRDDARLYLSTIRADMDWLRERVVLFVTGAPHHVSKV